MPAPEPTTEDGSRQEVYDALEREFGVLVRRARGFSARMSRDLHPDLEPGAYAMLLWLDDAGPVRMTDLAAFFGIGKPTVSRQLKIMEGLDLITREVEEGDRRAQRVTLSAHGAELVHQARGARWARYESTLAHWPDDDVQLFARLLLRINAEMGQPWTPPPE
ncbi:MarR family winged helix-turn-helix transcriptional regulator [Kineosporia succinea]|uniref:DNA-binding MarR family transcriptional regulator n=1 Tax=Kineosporia succinea TaxID=84632 RepID=A0ABT9PFL1_9ACTN|nr:MarR family winged helix-turn-helix transcriptional regulator [Kineosporia succinea]MDP9831179.1 DNA-binding MarR family transcriptional regulator [Kineosporia succinea]